MPSLLLLLFAEAAELCIGGKADEATPNIAARTDLRKKPQVA